MQAVDRHTSRTSSRDGLANAAVVAVTIGMALCIGFAIADPGANRVFGGVVGAMPLIVLALVVIPILVAIAHRPQRGALLLAALVPYYGLLIIVKSRPPFAYGWKEALALYTLAWSLQKTPKKQRLRRPLPLVMQPILLYASVGVAWVVVNRSVQAVVGVKVNFFWLVLGIILWRTPLNTRDRDRLVSILMADALITSVIGIAQQAVGHVYLQGLGYSYNTNIRFTGSFLRSFSTMDNPFNFGFYLTFALLFILPHCLDDPRRTRNWLFMLCSPVVLAALIFTFVRGAWLALAVGCAYLAVRRYRVFFLAAPFIVIALFVLPGNFSNSALASGSLQQRQQGWAQNLNKAVAKPFGNGIGTTGASGFKAAAVSKDVVNVYEPDNQYYKALYELGVFGVWFLLLMLGSIFRAGREHERGLHGEQRAWAMSLSAYILGAMVAGTVSTWFEIFPNDLYLWFMLAVVVSMTKTSERTSTALV